MGVDGRGWVTGVGGRVWMSVDGRRPAWMSVGGHGWVRMAWSRNFGVPEAAQLPANAYGGCPALPRHVAAHQSPIGGAEQDRGAVCRAGARSAPAVAVERGLPSKSN